MYTVPVKKARQYGFARSGWATKCVIYEALARPGFDRFAGESV
jgi:hypothetical protein